MPTRRLGCIIKRFNIAAREFWRPKKLSKLNALGNKLTKLLDGIQHCLNLKDINFKNNKILVIGQFPVPKLKEDKKTCEDDFGRTRCNPV